MLRALRFALSIAVLASSLAAQSQERPQRRSQEQSQRAATQSARSSPDAKPTLAAADYAKWETLGNGVLSPDGKWLAYDFRRGAGGTQLQYRPVDFQGDLNHAEQLRQEARELGTSTTSEHVVRSASNPQFTSNSRWLVYTVAPDTAGGGAGAGGRGRGGRGGGGGANRNRIAAVNLQSGTTQTFDDVQSFILSSDGSHIALRRSGTPGRRTADVIVRDLDAGTEVTLGNVSDMAWSDDGSLLAMAIDVEGKTGNGIQLLSTRSGTIKSLDATDDQYIDLVWRAHSNDLAVLRTHLDSAFADTGYTVIAWHDAGNAAQKSTYDFSNDTGFPKEMRVSGNRLPLWSEDGSTIILGIAPREYKIVPERRAPGELPPARVQVWHYKDVREF
ncbi:MAG TPA: hypothetical protein VHV78_04235, partial [Gemmatimonadaceae bacterium]|nr:hypothetical protein [Gemmatimonadaceae bacterium]